MYYYRNFGPGCQRGGRGSVTEAVRRLAAATMLLLAVVGLLPLLPLVFGFHSADVTNDGAGTFYPATITSGNGFITCQQFQTPTVTLAKNTDYTNQRLFQCTNNWGSDVTLTWTLPDPNGSGIHSVGGSATIPAGAQNACAAVSLSTSATRVTNRTVVFQGTVDQADLYAEIQFPVRVTIQNTGTPATC